MSQLERQGGGSSFLVRLWNEPRAGGDEAAARVYVRDLRSGEERYLRRVEDVPDFLVRRQRAGRSAASVDEAGKRHQAG